MRITREGVAFPICIEGKNADGEERFFSFQQCLRDNVGQPLGEVKPPGFRRELRTLARAVSRGRVGRSWAVEFLVRESEPRDHEEASRTGDWADAILPVPAMPANNAAPE